MSTPVIIEAAINGATPKARQPHVPRTADEIVADAIACLRAGASIIHHHIDGDLDGETAAAEYLAIWRLVLAEVPDALLYPTFNFHRDGTHDVHHFAPLAASGLARIGLCDPGSTNLAGRWEHGVPRGAFVYRNSFDAIAEQMERCAELGLGPAMAIYEPGFLRVAMAWWRAGRLPAGAMAKLYLCDDNGAFGGGPFGLPPTRTGLDAYLEILGDAPIPWAVSVVGGDVSRTDVARSALDRGGHLHLGLEFYGGDRHPTNVELVDEAAALCTDLNRPVATAADAIRLLGLPSDGQYRW